MSTPNFDRPDFFTGFPLVCSTWGELEAELGAARRRYDAFLDFVLLPAQRSYAEFLENNQAWQYNRSPTDVETLLKEFRTIPCLNSPIEGFTEQIDRPEDCYPKLLYIVADSGSGALAADRHNLNCIDERFRFRDSEGIERLLAFDSPPYMQAFDRYTIRRKYEALGASVSRYTHLTSCIVVPKTDLFRNEGGGFWSRGYFGDFDVVTVCPAEI